MLILSINTGSSSIKYSVIDVSREEIILRGIVENIGADNSVLKQNNCLEEVTINEQFKNHEQAILKIIEMLTNPKYGAVRDLESISAVGHRVAHGGEKLFQPLVIDADSLELIKENIRLAPLHMPHMVCGIEMFRKLMPGKPMVAVFDTAFHQSIPEKAYLYAIPYEYYLKYGIRRYGFHGTSHKFVSRQAAKFLGMPLDSLKIITCHLGNGSSIAAVDKGRSVDTSMGFTPISGVPMGTRCGDIDAAIVGFLMENEGLTYKEVERIFNGKSGLAGLSGSTNDCRELERLIKNGDRRANTALDVFCYQVKKYIGAYTAVMDGVDCIVFTGGIGENSAFIRNRICNGMNYIGVQIDRERNDNGCKRDKISTLISGEQAKVKVCIVNTNEELMIGQETYEAITKGKRA